jgi:branched-chain amino acid transport system substrate-binding protein
MESFQKVYGRIPTDYAAQAFDTANLIASGLAAVKGAIANQNAFREALEKADFKSVRTPFTFNTNHVPVLDYYARKVVKQSDGKLAIKTIAKVYTARKDAFYTQCKM